MTADDLMRDFLRAKRDGRPIEELAELRDAYEAAALAEAPDETERRRRAALFRTAHEIDEIFVRVGWDAMRDRAEVRRSCAGCSRRVLLLFRDGGRWVLWTSGPRGAIGRGGSLRFVTEDDDTTVTVWCRCGRRAFHVAEIFAWRNGSRDAALDPSSLGPGNDRHIGLRRVSPDDWNRPRPLG